MDKINVKKFVRYPFFSVNILKIEGNFFMQMTEFCDHLYDESTDSYIQILKLNDENLL